MGEIDGQARVSQSSDLASDNARFDASQYEFFGKVVLEEVELGGLEDDGDDAALLEPDDKDHQFFPHRDREEGEGIGLLSDIDDLSSTFSKLNRTVSEPRSMGNVHGTGSFSRGNSLTADWAQDPDFPNWIDQHILDAENAQDSKRWSSQPYPFSPESKPLYRTSSYPQQPHPYPHQNIPTEPVNVPRSSFTSYPPQSEVPVPFSNRNLPPFSPPTHFTPGPPHGLQFAGGNMGQFANTHHPPRNHWPNQAGPLPGLHHSPDGIMHHHRLQQMQPGLPHFPNMQPQPYGYSPHPYPLELRDPRMRPLQRGRQFRSKYMSTEEIENILRIQHAATHSGDPYTEDYYHQACLAKKFAGSNSRPRHHFCPTSIRDLPSHAKAYSEPHAYLQVDALGRIPFSSIRRPRPLLEVDLPTPNSSDNEILNPKLVAVKTLDQEPMLAARITIEDGLCLLLDVDDINRLLNFSQPPDGGVQLRQRRQGLLEELASSLELVDPLGHGVSQNDDLVFLRIASLLKGRKLLSCYLKLLHPSDELARISCMAVFRHLRFLFGEMPMDPAASKTIADLANAVTSIVRGMDLVALGLCLAAVVCSSEQPPLRPLGSPAGDGASNLVKSVLDRATELLTDQNVASNYSIRNRELWQESFNSFFGLLTKYCINKYEGIIASFVPMIGPEVGRAISREMPVDLLRASLPHTNEIQRKLLLDFAQRSMPFTGYSSNGSSNGPPNSESVLS